MWFMIRIRYKLAADVSGEVVRVMSLFFDSFILLSLFYRNCGILHEVSNIGVLLQNSR